MRPRDVYLAYDVVLNRRVAIKVLHPALSGDEAFLKRFRAEARAAAVLNHPNILQVYDWGEERGEPYLVLEYLAGGSLRDVYDTGALLSPEQAVQIGLQVTAGLDYAHRRGFVHRDIKPANLLFDGERRLRIADFGLARALAEAAWTEPEGAILGTARYAAPEQIESFVLDGKADVYALALLLYEGVTGEAPFIGDTTISTLMARMNALLPEHDALGPLGEVLLWAAAPEPSERYDAAQFALRLHALAVALPEPAPLPLGGGQADDGGGDAGAALEGGRNGNASATLIRTGEVTELGVPAATGNGSGNGSAAVAGATRTVSNGTGPPAVDGPVAKRRRRWPWVSAVVVLVGVLVAAGVMAVVKSRILVPSHPIPALVGKTLPEARASVRADHFTVRSTGSTSSLTVPVGSVVTQNPGPRAGGKAVQGKEGSVISVVLSSGPPLVPIPNLTSFSSCNDAVQALAAVHLAGVCPSSAAQYSSTVAAGGVLGTSPTGSVRYGSTVTIVTSKGHPPVDVPSVVGTGSSYASASASLSAAGFVPSENQEYSSTVPSGQAIGTSPSPTDGPQPFGSTVTVDVSLGPKPVAVPDLVLQSVASATAALQALGLQVGGPYGPSGATRVLYTSPVAGTSVLPGATVSIYAI